MSSTLDLLKGSKEVRAPQFCILTGMEPPITDFQLPFLRRLDHLLPIHETVSGDNKPKEVKAANISHWQSVRPYGMMFFHLPYWSAAINRTPGILGIINWNTWTAGTSPLRRCTARMGSWLKTRSSRNLRIGMPWQLPRKKLSGLRAFVRTTWKEGYMSN